MSLVDAVRERQCRPMFGGWPRPRWAQPTTKAPAIFDADDVDYFVGEIVTAKCRDAVDVMLEDATVAENIAAAAEYVDQAHGEADYLREYARVVRLACRIAAWALYEAPPPRTSTAPVLDAAEIKSRVDIVNYIDKHVRLVKAGHEHFVGICPFHDDHRPSMHVWSKGNWKCFSCGAGGDVFAFVRRWYKCEFREALQILSGGT